jgi:protein SCO1
VLLATGCGGGSGTSATSTTGETTAYRGIPVPDNPEAPPVSLRDPQGNTVTLAEQRGRWVLLTFLYTWCPDVCPVIAGNLNAALKSPPGKRAELKVLSVSVDPKRDTPAAAKRYARDHRLSPGFVWLLGTKPELSRVWRAYDIAVLPGPKGTVTHATPTLLVDPEGRIRLVYDTTVQTADVVHDLRQLEGG